MVLVEEQGAAEEVVVGGGVGPCPQSPGRHHIEYALEIVRRRRPRVLSTNGLETARSPRSTSSSRGM